MDFKTMKTLFQDARGEISSVAEKADVLHITSVAGSRRANHYHKRFGHLCIVTVGEIRYYERSLGDEGKPSVRTFSVGELFDTGPLMEHLMVFQKYTEFYCVSYGARDSESYEDDTVRLRFELDQQ